MSISIKPLGNRVVVEPIEQEEITAGGIVLPETAKEKPQKGTSPVRRPWRSGRRWRSYPDGRQRRRYRSVRQVCRHRNQGE